MGKYTEDQKQQVLTEVKETGSISLVARKNDIPVSTIHTWLKKINKDSANVSSFASVAKIKQLKKDLSDKELENQILRDLLKKTYQVWPQN